MTTENFSYLPTSVILVGHNDTAPVLAQWMYKIICQPLKDYLPTSFLQPTLDLKSRVAYMMNDEKYRSSKPLASISLAGRVPVIGRYETSSTS